MEAAESVEDAGQTAAKVKAAAIELVEAVDMVSAVIEENSAAPRRRRLYRTRSQIALF